MGGVDLTGIYMRWAFNDLPVLSTLNNLPGTGRAGHGERGCGERGVGEREGG